MSVLGFVIIIYLPCAY